MSDKRDRSGVPAVVKELTVPISAQAAFDLFTEGMESWWPFKSHSVFQEEKRSFVFECRVGGRLLEVGPDGEEAVWGSVISFNRPRSFQITWHPGRGPEAAQEVEITFEELGGETLVRLVHSGFDRLGERAAEVRESYQTGWDFVFVDQFGEASRG